MTDVQVIDGNLFIKSDAPPIPEALPATQGYHYIPQYSVPHAKALLAAGYNVPHPIHEPSIFNYEGPYTPYMRQKETAGFLAWHDKAWCLNDMGCVDKDTEFLTPNGWKNITDYQEGDLVAQYNPETKSTEFIKPEGYVDLPNTNGKMVEFYGPWNASQVVTADHTMLVEGAQKGKYRSMKASELVNKIANRRGGCEHRGKFKNRYGTEYRAKRSFNLKPIDSWINSTDDRFTLGIFTLFCWDTKMSMENGTACIAVPDYLMDIAVTVLMSGHLSIHRTSVHAEPKGKPFELVHIDLDWEITYEELLMDVLQSPKQWGCKLTRQLVSRLQETSIDSGCYKSRRVKQGLHVASYEARQAMVSVMAEFGGTCGRNYGDSPHEIEQCPFNNWQVFRFMKRSPLGLDKEVPESWSRYYDGCYKVVGNRFRKYCFVTDTGFWVAKRKHHIYVTGNTGKTASAIWATEFLRQTEHLRKTLIITTLSTMDVVWKQELFQLYPGRSAAVVAGDKKRKLMLVKQPYKYLIINHDGFKQPYLLDAIMALDDIDLVILDEASGFRNHSTARYKALSKMLRAKPQIRFWPLTGTPAPQAPTDVWALSRLVNPEGTPPYFQRFKQETMIKVSQFEWVPRPESSKIVQEVMQPAIRVRAADCDDIPKLMPPTRVEAPMSDEQDKYFKIMRDQMVMEYKAQDSSHVVTAVNAAVLMTKLMQICCGNLYDVNKNTVHLKNDKRLKATFDAAVEAGAGSYTKAIIFVPFKHSQKAVLDYFNENGLKSVLVNGDTPSKDRKVIFDNFQNDTPQDGAGDIYALPDTSTVRVLIAHPRVAAHGLTLTAASCIIWFAPYASLEYYQQANARIARTGQTQQHLRVVHIGSHSVEWQLYKKLEKKGALQNEILSLYEGLMNDPTN